LGGGAFQGALGSRIENRAPQAAGLPCEGGAEGAKEGWGGFLELLVDRGFVAEAFFRDRFQVDVNGVRGEGPVSGRCGDDDRAGDRDGFSVVDDASRGNGDCGSGGEARDGFGDFFAERGDMVEDDDAVSKSVTVELSRGSGDGWESGGWIDDVAESAGQRCFTAAFWAGDDQRGIRTGGAECCQEPILGGLKGRFGEMEDVAEVFDGGERRVDGMREWARVDALEEMAVVVGTDLATLGGDFEDVMGGIGQIEENGVGVAGIAAVADAGEDFDRGRARLVGVGGEHTDGVGERGLRREDFVFAVEVDGQVFAKIG